MAQKHDVIIISNQLTSLLKRFNKFCEQFLCHATTPIRIYDFEGYFCVVYPRELNMVVCLTISSLRGFIRQECVVAEHQCIQGWRRGTLTIAPCPINIPFNFCEKLGKINQFHISETFPIKIGKPWMFS